MTLKVIKPWDSVAKVWYRYLQLAIKSNQKINWKYYSDWGDKEYISKTSFAKWWREKGIVIFTPKPLEVNILEKNKSYVTVRIPMNIRKNDAYTQISEILKSCESKGTIGNQLKYAPTGRVNTKTLIRYQRLIEIDLNPKYKGTTAKKKAEALLEVYEKNHERLTKPASTLLVKGKSSKIKTPDIKKLKGKAIDTKIENKTIDPRVAHRWLTQGRKVLKNVAKGEFPGSGYY